MWICMDGFTDMHLWVMIGPKWRGSDSGRLGIGKRLCGVGHTTSRMLRYNCSHLKADFPSALYVVDLKRFRQVSTSSSQFDSADLELAVGYRCESLYRSSELVKSTLIRCRTGCEVNITHYRRIQIHSRILTKIYRIPCKIRYLFSRSIGIGYGVRHGVVTRVLLRPRLVRILFQVGKVANQ